MKQKLMPYISFPFRKIRCFILKNGWYNFWALVISGTSSIAAVATAIVSWKTMDVNEAISNKVMALQKESLIQKSSLNNAIEQVALYGDMIAAAGGYRVAYLRVLDKLISPKNIPDMSIYQAEHLLNSIKRFKAHPKKNIDIKTIMYENSIITNTTELLSHLKSANRDTRLYAINSIYVLRLNKLIPNLAKLIEEDKDMNVIQYALYVVVEALRNNIKDSSVSKDFDNLNFTIESPNQFRLQFNTLWDQYGQTIKARLPRELKQIPSKEYPKYCYKFLYDPERKENIPLPEKDDEFWFETPTLPQLK